MRGMRVAEAVETVRTSSTGVMLGFSEIRILHGKGTGALKEEIRNYLRTVPLVRSAKDEHEEMGGAGITVVKLDI
ncbi:MAG: Smr/MutS family protein [Alistipes sp.]